MGGTARRCQGSGSHGVPPPPGPRAPSYLFGVCLWLKCLWPHAWRVGAHGVSCRERGSWEAEKEDRHLQQPPLQPPERQRSGSRVWAGAAGRGGAALRRGFHEAEGGSVSGRVSAGGTWAPHKHPRAVDLCPQGGERAASSNVTAREPGSVWTPQQALTPTGGLHLRRREVKTGQGGEPAGQPSTERGELGRRQGRSGRPWTLGFGGASGSAPTGAPPLPRWPGRSRPGFPAPLPAPSPPS